MIKSKRKHRLVITIFIKLNKKYKVFKFKISIFVIFYADKKRNKSIKYFKFFYLKKF